MKWFKKTSQPYPRVLVHDPACQQSPCLCIELRELRRDKKMLELIDVRAKRYDMARELLDGEQGG